MNAKVLIQRLLLSEKAPLVPWSDRVNNIAVKDIISYIDKLEAVLEAAEFITSLSKRNRAVSDNEWSSAFEAADKAIAAAKEE